MHTIHFYNKERATVLQFTDFQVSYADETIKTIKFTGNVNYEGFQFEGVLEAEAYDFKNLADTLEALHQSKQDNASFNPLQSPVVLQFANKEHHIQVKGEIYSNLYTTHLEFNYTIDQSFIPELVADIREIIICLAS